jgi:hypothetical protein
MAAAEFDRDRLCTVLPRLRARYQEVMAREEFDQWRADYEVLKVKRDALAAELCEVYPRAVAQFADLFTRIADNDEELSRLHQARPSGVALHLLGAELAARNLGSFSTADPSITKVVQLPDWTNSAKMAWPPPRLTDPTRFASAPFDRRYSGDWWQVKEEEARALRERQEREGKEQEAKALENYHGLRWWEGKRT